MGEEIPVLWSFLLQMAAAEVLDCLMLSKTTALFSVRLRKQGLGGEPHPFPQYM